ncbi:hypothetical protein SPW_7329 [Streptomyces sp. W007]|uniref:hypothetical protein n=1 Tax=Streptomyces sp. W007 TaxID=1055352 RepID=UPI000241A770|nr:hypothetical protein [Streptomyces sp. W007]EHM24235.1 hypothetical protein SPW_7329 [Streptomyces sp. W007]
MSDQKIRIVGGGQIPARLIPTTIHTADGSQVTITRRGLEFDLETRNARGETISTVVMNSDDVSALLTEMDEEVGNDAYEEGYAKGYKDAERDAA